MDSTWLQNFEGLNRVEIPSGGWLAEMWKRPEMGQLTLRCIPSGGWVSEHCHPNTDEWWIVVSGKVIINLRFPSKSRTLELGRQFPPQLLEVPRGTWHSLLNKSAKEEVLLLFFANRVYNPDEPDKEIA